MAQVRLTRRAFADLRRLRAWLADKNPRAAGDASEVILSSFDKLADFPELGVQHPTLALRELVIRFGRHGYIARYRIDGDRVVVTRIFHGRERR
jgi:plasmid stabilization system protein ParE